VSYRSPLREQLFLLGDVLEIGQHAALPGFADAPLDVIEQILGEAARFTSEVLAPLNRVGDRDGCIWHADNTVVTPPGFKEAYKALAAAGWPGLGAAKEFGGQGLPYVINVAFSEMSSSANMAFSMYPGLTHGAYSAILNGGSDEQKTLYLPRLASGQWAGTMNLTEPQCGTDLGLLRTRAAPAGDGSYKISGEKIWISGGEHDLTENIVHLVLARIEGAPAGTRGISLFIVPKFIPAADGALGARNGVACAGIEEKMGIHANATCVMIYDQATGWLVGEENRGLALMFVMMNEARLGVGLQGLAQGEAAGPLPHRPEKSAGPGGPDHRPPRCPADADGRSGRARRRQGLPVLDGAAGRSGAAPPGRRGAPKVRGRTRPDDAGGQGVPYRSGFRHLLRRPAGARGRRIHRGFPGQPVSARLPHRPDLRRNQRHPGPRPRRPQAGRQRRAGDDGLLR
jgi:alkylation response protein AidB-like acyl-CoA dehydrogenase